MGFLPRISSMKLQTTNTSVVVWFWVNSMLVFEVDLYCLDLRNGCTKKKRRILGFQRKCCQNFVKKTPVLVLAID